MAGQHYLSKFTRKQITVYQPQHEVGTDKNDVDYEWIPRTNFIGTFLILTKKMLKDNKKKIGRKQENKFFCLFLYRVIKLIMIKNILKIT